MHVRRTRPLLGLLVAMLLAGTVHPLGQQVPTFRAPKAVVVPVFVTVTDADQRLVANLVREDFEILDNDKPQPLVVFDNVNQPFSGVVMLDTSGSMTLSLALLRQAAEQFFMRLFPEDKARVGAFNDKIEIGSRFSSNRDALIAEVKNLDYGNATRLWDAMATSLDALKGITGRRVVLIFTDGDDTGSDVGVSTILNRAREEEVMVYAIGLESNFGGVRTKPDGSLKKLAEETGGGYFELKRDTDLGSTFTRVAAELHSQYTLGFTPTVLDNKTHKLTVKLKQAGLKARARRNYVAKEDSAAGTNEAR